MDLLADEALMRQNASSQYLFSGHQPLPTSASVRQPRCSGRERTGEGDRLSSAPSAAADCRGGVSLLSAS
ncbi:hypothetical protein A4R35_00960 [Thermogemmatispora tikiterensis]|uniref:Uncharacterized protein n=1 Tax=Thermogemmatispora tikiterensis TaxID=1825093 RepID=A0A328VDM3_9CHLR|nr:hypothetical protein A4R35_00960 [Thermogemmatispora tikiterensis]